MIYVIPSSLFLPLIVVATFLFSIFPVLGKADTDLKEDILVASNTVFAFNLYTQLREQEPGNLFFSPYSLSLALAMTYAGARNQTARQIVQVLRLPPQAATQIHPLFAQLQKRVNQAQQHVKIHVANALWGETNHPFLPSFRELIAQNYDANLNLIDFNKSFATAHVKINAWVKEQTQNQITQLLKPGLIDSLTRLVLVNAIYFKGNWNSPFDNQQTKNVPFWLNSHRNTTIPMMKQENHFGYAENQLLQILELPYVGSVNDDEESIEFAFTPNRLSMIILLPRQRDGLSQLENSLNRQNLETWLSQINWRKVKVTLPKFKINMGFDLAKTLAAMGMPDAFNSKADFSGIDGSKALYLKSVIHQAFVEVNEEGTEAAASTGVVATTRGIQPSIPLFVADHPFLFLISHKTSGSILFLGRLVKPANTLN
jgi:serine protease inhibitor